MKDVKNQMDSIENLEHHSSIESNFCLSSREAVELKPM